jgi:hypothetical protein
MTGMAQNILKGAAIEGDNPVGAMLGSLLDILKESGCLRLQPKQVVYPI